ncbi:MAG: flagellar hook basal-body protein [Sphingomonadales bacterium]|nr:flagellar hook basal-body protein [Sphingomonadales bacterium]
MTFYASLSGLQAAQTDLNVISNNIANANTNGFKASTAAFADLVSASALTDPSLTIGLGTRTQAITQQFSLGSMQQTGNALDLAINGDGFFVTQSPTGTTSYTRVGAFKVDGAGGITDSAGDLVQVFPVNGSGTPTSTTSTSSATVALTNAAGSAYTGMSVSGSGVLTASYADGSTTPIGAIALANFPQDSGLRQQGGATWTATGLSGAATLGQAGTGDYGPLLSGTLEGSNVDLASQLVGLVGAQQDFQANSKAIDTDTQIMQTIINMRTG